MALTYLSGINDDYLGMPARPRRGVRSTDYENKAAARLERRRAALAIRRAIIADKLARRKVLDANEATQISEMDEFGARGKAKRQEARAKRQEARVATKKAKAARKAAVKAARVARKVAKKAARSTRRVTRKAARQERKAIAPQDPMEQELMEQDPMDQELMEQDPMDQEEMEQDPMDQDPGDSEEDDLGLDFLGLDELGARGKARRAARKAKRKTKRSTRGGSILKKITASPVRGAFLLLMKLNALKIRTKLRQAWIKDKAAVEAKIIKRFGFNRAKFLVELNRKENEKLSGFGEPVSISAAIAAATPVIAATLSLLKSLKVPVSDFEEDLKLAKEGKETITDRKEKSNNNLLLIGGVGLAAVAVMAMGRKKSNS